MRQPANFLPWTGPTIRASAALHIPVSDIFLPLLPVQAVGLLFVFGTAYYLGKREEKRLGLDAGRAVASDLVLGKTLTAEEEKLRRPQNFWLNIVLTLVVMGAMISGKVEPMVMFMIGTVLALIINFRDVDMQRARIDAHAKAALLMASILLAAGVFTGIMKDSGMLKAMAASAVAYIPESMATHIPFVLGLIAMPLSLLFDPDSFYFGVLPVVAEVGKMLNVPALQVGQAALLGQMTTGFPVSPLTPATWPVPHRTGRTPEIFHSHSVGGVGRDDVRLCVVRNIPNLTDVRQSVLKQTRMIMKKVRISAGAGYSGDRIEPAVELADR